MDGSAVGRSNSVETGLPVGVGIQALSTAE
jgi:hypothetical protein